MSKKQTITKREKQILMLMTEGNTSLQIGHKLSISLKTVETHRKNLLTKFNALNAVHLVYLAAKSNII